MTHIVDQMIREIVVFYDDYARHIAGLAYCVGMDGVTRIEACSKNGEYCDIPYIRVWKGDTAVAEFCQHKLAAVYFSEEPF